MVKNVEIKLSGKQLNPQTSRILIFLAFAIAIFNVLYALTTVLGISPAGLGTLGTFGGIGVSGNVEQGAMLPYGITFDNAGYEKLLEYYRTLTLDGEQKQRFIRVGTREKTGCGPCCGIGNGPGIDSSGNTRCGCGHNFALIGLMKHLVKNYGDKYSDDQIFEEVVRWKKLFFPGQVADDGSVIR